MRGDRIKRKCRCIFATIMQLLLCNNNTYYYAVIMYYLATPSFRRQ